MLLKKYLSPNQCVAQPEGARPGFALAGRSLAPAAHSDSLPFVEGAQTFWWKGSVAGVNLSLVFEKTKACILVVDRLIIHNTLVNILMISYIISKIKFEKWGRSGLTGRASSC